MLAIVDKYMLEELRKSNHPGRQATLDMLNGLTILLERYVAFQQADKWEIVAVEKSFVMPLFDNYGYGMRLDLLIKETTGPLQGAIRIVDHKFVYDFYNANILRINAQMPKYLATVRNDTGLTIHDGVLNMIRHRTKKGPMTDEELFRREPLRPSSTRIRNIMREQIKASEEIMERHALPVDEYGQRAKRVLNQMVCNNCSFLDLCMFELDGGNPSLMLKTEFQPNSYGYNNQESDA